jgi:ribose transport system substrate-binding protein
MFRTGEDVVQTHGSKRRTGRISILGLLIATALIVAACGSSSTSSTGTTSAAATSTSASSGGSSAPNPNTVYAPGVPTLNELYKGNVHSPPTSGPPVKKGLSIVFVSCGQEAPGCAGVPDAMEAPAKKLGWSFRIINGKLDTDNGWPNGVREAVAAKPSLIIVHGMNCPEVEQPLKEAKAAHIPVMGLEDVDCNDKFVGGEKLFSIPMEYTETMKSGGEYFYQWGAYQADYAIDATKGKGKIIQTVYETPFGKHQGEGQNTELAKCKECKVEAKIPFTAAEQTADGALFQKFTTDLTAHPEANVALLNFDTDTNTAGLSKAVVDAGRAKTMVVIGGEGYAPADQLVREEKGDTAEPAAHDASWIAWGALDEINRYFNGKEPVPEGSGFVTVDKNHNMPPAGKNYETTIPYQEAYEKIWGLG